MFDKNVTDKENFDSFWNEVVLANFKEARIAFKTDTKFMRFLGWFSRNFYENMVTVIGTTIYFPSQQKLESSYERNLRTIAHEFVHMVDRSEEPKLVYEIKYLFPQALAGLSLFSFFAFTNAWYLLFLLFLVFLAPISSAWRTHYEANGYAMTLFMLFKGSPPNSAFDNLNAEMAGWICSKDYWYASRDRQLVESMILDRYERLPESHRAFLEVKKWLQIQES